MQNKNFQKIAEIQKRARLLPWYFLKNAKSEKGQDSSLGRNEIK
jgi:hypothetical protein